MRRLSSLALALALSAGAVAAGPSDWLRHGDEDHGAGPNAVEQLQAQGPLTFAPAGETTDRFDVVAEPEVVHVRAHDGVTLHARVFRPDTSADPAYRTPVILVHSPYYAGSILGGNDRSMDLVEFFTPKGYAVALTDVRGTGNSGGCASQDGLDQAEDFKTLVEHFSAQTWSNGRVGSYGKSYDAETQNAGAVLTPSGLATMVTVAGISGLYDVAFYDGVPLGANGLASAAIYLPFSVGVPTDPEVHPGQVRRFDCQAENAAGPANVTGDMTTYWQDREFRLRVADIPQTTSMLHVHGLGDPTVTPIAIDGWYDHVPGMTRAIWGQWAHNYPYDAPERLARDDWYDAIHAWFDYFLLDLETGVEAWPPVQVQSDRNTWRAVRSFAEMGQHVSLPLAAGGVLDGAVADGDTMAVSEDGPAQWSTAPLDVDTHLTGRAVLDMVLTLDRPDAHFAVVLEEVTAGGAARKLTEGWLSGMHRDGLESGDLIPLGEEVRYKVRTYPFDATLSAGSTLRLRLSGDEGSGLAAETDWAGTILLDGSSTLLIQVEDAPCGIELAQRSEPEDDVADCRGGVPSRTQY